MLNIITVINGLEHCTKDCCSGCPYGGSQCQSSAFLRDILEALRSLRNRILTLDEIAEADFVYVEFNPRETIVDHLVEPCGVSQSHKKGFLCLLLMDCGTYSYKQFFNIEDYNIIWRCWRTRPTAWEMKNTKWSE